MLLASCMLLALGSPDPAFDPGPNPLLMKHPTVNATTVVFSYAGDLWSVPRTGGDARRLTASIGTESDPYFSPDGTQIAFTGQYDGNVDAYVMPAEGGVPKRLTAHPGADRVQGWTSDGKSVLLQSNMLSNTDYPRLFTVSANGGVPRALPLPSGVEGSFSPDGTRLAYIANGKWQQAWKRYRGGQTTTIWIAQLSDSRVKGIPRQGTDDHSPMWVGDSIYYLTDPEGPIGLNRYDVSTGKVTEEIKGAGFDIKSATAGPGVIAYERLGSLNLYDLAKHESTRLNITIRGDFPEVRSALKNVAPAIGGLGISPSGSRIVASARGWIFTLPAAKGDARLLGGAQGVNRRDPAWSPDGKTIAFVTDEDGTQNLSLYDVATGKEKHLALADSPGYYYHPVWSPDGKRIAYTSEKLGLYILDVESGKSVKVDRQTYRGRADVQPSWSPDSKWLTWSRDLENCLNACFLYSVDSGKVTQITDGLSDAANPVFDLDGKTLYFTASTDTGTASNFEDISGYAAINTTSSVYAVVLRKDLPNPLQPESDEETPKADAPKADAAKPDSAKPDSAKPEEKKEDKAAFSIDLDGIEQRIIALPMKRQRHLALFAGPAGSVFALSQGPRATVVDESGPAVLSKFTFADRKESDFYTGVTQFQATFDGSKVLLGTDSGLVVVPTAAPPAPGSGRVSTDGLRVKIDPRAEWTAMYHEVWRNERLLLYDANLHGVDSIAMEKRYEPFLANLATRADLNYLFTDMLGELSVGHMFIGGGDSPRVPQIAGGLLGADYQFENGRYKLARIYDGERWNPDLYAPLAQPGVNAKVGEYVLAIDGQDLNDSKDIYLQLEGKAGKQIKVKLGPTPDGKDSREVVVVPIGDEFDLRFRAWSEDNRRTIDKLTGGKVGYVHVPDTSPPGWREFQRYYYAQSSKSGMIVDDRFNHGGAINDFMVAEMEKKVDFLDISRYGQVLRDPSTAVYGPKVMLCNEMAGSGGDIFPYIFKKHKVGKLVGKRTWGAMISSYGFQVIDGGSVRAPDDAMVDVATGDWCIENEGVTPDIAVELDPYLWRQGRDAQLEAAVEQIKKDLLSYVPVKMDRPKYPIKTKLPGKG
jgi:tricorn protease